MAINITLVDTEGQDWDVPSGVSPIGSPVAGLGVVDGENDTFDGGLVLGVNSTGIDPLTASLDFNGREINSIPVFTPEGIAVTRSILVSDATISPVGFARFLDSFTNTTNADITFTASWNTNSGADGATAFQATSSGDTVLQNTDFGFVVDDGNTTAADSSWGFAYGNGKMPPASSAILNGDLVTIQHTITLKPGETKSLLSFAVQNNSSAESITDYAKFTRALNDMRGENLLAGLTERELSQVVNYSYDGSAASIPGPLGLTVLTDGEGNRWGVNNNRMGLQTLDTDVLREANPGEVVFQNLKTNPTTLIAEDGQEATFQGTFFRTRTGSYSVMASPEDGFVRVMWKIDYTDNAPNAVFQGDYGLKTIFASAQNLIGDRNVNGTLGDGVLTIGDGGVVLDDSVSGAGGTRPAVTLVFGDTSNIDATNSSFPNTNNTEEKNQLSGNSFVATDGAINGAPLVPTPFDTFSLLYFIALNDDALGGVADLAKLIRPDYKALAGLSAFEVSKIRNFNLTEADRLQDINGDAAANTIQGHYWGDHMLGGDGNDTLIGLGSDDRLEGGNGNDTLLGGISDDRLEGDAGADRLDGGTGDDLMIGGADNDVFIVDSTGDKIVDTTGEGVLDWVQTSISYSLLTAAGGGDPLQIEKLSTTDANSTATIDLTGDTYGQFIEGNAGANIIHDGGAGASDRLSGLGGNDTYIVNNTGDTITENASAGALDIVQTSVNYGLGTNVFVERLETTNAAGTAAINLIGNSYGQTIIGNAGANKLNDGGGAGADTLSGLGGDDTYFVNNMNTQIVEGLNDGTTDTALASGTYTLGAGVYVERLFTANEALSGSINLTGNEIAQTAMRGNAGANVLNGKSGSDTMTGLGGADTFVFDTALGPGNIDRITDFSVADDTINLDDAIFAGAGFTAGQFIAASAFVIGTAATTPDHRIIYNSANGNLTFDFDGTGAGAAIVFARLPTGLTTMTNNDFFVV